MLFMNFDNIFISMSISVPELQSLVNNVHGQGFVIQQPPQQQSDFNQLALTHQQSQQRDSIFSRFSFFYKKQSKSSAKSVFPFYNANGRSSSSLVKKLFGNLLNSPRSFIGFNPQVYQLINQSILVVLANSVSIFSVENHIRPLCKSQINSAREKQLGQQIKAIVKKATLYLYHDIKQIIVPKQQLLVQFSFLKAIVRYQKNHRITLLKIPMQLKEIKVVKQLTFGDDCVRRVYFLSQKEFIVLGMPAFQKKKKHIVNLYHYSWIDDKIEQLRKFTVIEQNDQEEKFQIMSISIETTHQSSLYVQQQFSLTIFLSIYHKKLQCSHIYAKQLKISSYGSFKVDSKTVQVVQIKHGYDNLVNMQVWRFKNYFYFVIRGQLLIVKKKDKTYLPLDSVIAQSEKQRLFFWPNTNIICCTTDHGINLYEVNILNNKCKLRLMDFIKVNNPKISQRLHSFWIFKQQQYAQLGLITLGHQGTLYFYGTDRMSQLDKLVVLVNNSKNQQIKDIEELSARLGISKNQFYLKLWQKSGKNGWDIENLLFECQDVMIMDNQLANCLRKKRMKVGEIMRFLDKKQKFLARKLSQKLDVKYFQYYLEVMLISKKLLLFDFQTKLGFRQYEEIYQQSIFELINETIQRQLFPPKKPKYKFGYAQPPIRPMIHLNHILQHFKLFLLQNYQQFIVKLLQHFPRHIATILETFPQLLPNYPLHIDISSEQSNQIYQTCTYALTRMKESNGQPVWFGNIIKSDWVNQKMQYEIVLQLFSKYHSTSQVQSVLKTLIQSQWFKKEKYKTHCFIVSKYRDYRDLIQKFKEKELYFAVCELANETQRNLKNVPLNQEEQQYLTFIKNYLKGFLDEEYINRLSINSLIHPSLASIDASINRRNSNMLMNSSIRSMNLNNSLKLLNSQRVKPKSQYQMVKALPAILALTNLDQNQQRKVFLLRKIQMDLDARSMYYSNRRLASNRILESLKNNNHLTKSQFQQMKLYCMIHNFLRSYQLIEKQKSVLQVFWMSSEELISLFFLGNIRKKQLIFTSFQRIFADKARFNEMIQQYVNSNVSSRIQVEMMLIQLTGKDKTLQQQRQFQARNIQLINIVINGYLKKIEFDEDQNLMNFLATVDKVFLKEDFLYKLYTLQIIRKNALMFTQLGIEDKNLFELIYNSKAIIMEIIENYFNEKFKMKNLLTLKAKDGEKKIDSPKALLQLILHLNDEIFYDIQTKELFMIFCCQLVEWQQFNQLQQIIYGDIGQEILSQQHQTKMFVKQLQARELDKVYSHEKWIFKESSINYIRSILCLDKDGDDPFIISQQAKLFMVRLFMKWKKQVSFQLVDNICTIWVNGKQDQSRRQMIEQMIKNHVDVMNLDDLSELYVVLEIYAQGKVDIDTENQQFYHYLGILSTQMLRENRYDEALFIIGKIRLSDFATINYEIETKCILHSLSLRQIGTLNQLNQLAISQKQIEFIVLNYEKNDIIGSLFSQQLETDAIKNKSYDWIEVSSIICLQQKGKGKQSKFFKNHGIRMSINDLKAIVNQLSVKKKSNKQLHFQIFCDNEDFDELTDKADITKFQKDDFMDISNVVEAKSAIMDQDIMVQKHSEVQAKHLSITTYKRMRKMSEYVPNDKKRKNNNRTYFDIVSTYYFLLMSLRIPKKGLLNLYCGNYNLDFLLQCLEKLNNLVKQKRDYWRINMEEIVRMFKKGLFVKMLVIINNLTCSSQIQIQLEYADLRDLIIRKKTQFSEETKTQVMILVNAIKQVDTFAKKVKATRQYINKKHAKLIEERRMEKLKQDQILQEMKINKLEKIQQENDSYGYISIKDLQDSRQQQNLYRKSSSKPEELFQLNQLNKVVKDMLGNKKKTKANQVTLAFKQMKEKKNTDTQVFRNDEFSSFRNRMQGQQSKRYREQIKKCPIPQFLKLIHQKDFVTIKKLPSKLIENRLQQIFDSKNINFSQIIQILKHTNNSEKTDKFDKISPQKLDEYSLQLKKIFTVQYFLSDNLMDAMAGDSDNEDFQKFKPVINEYIKNMDADRLKGLACLISEIFGNDNFGEELYKMALIHIGKNGTYDDKNKNKIQKIVAYMNEDYLMKIYTQIFKGMVQGYLRDKFHQDVLKKMEELRTKNQEYDQQEELQDYEQGQEDQEDQQQEYENEQSMDQSGATEESVIVKNELL